MLRVVLLLLIISCQNENTENIPQFKPLQKPTAKATPYDFEAKSLKDEKKAGCGEEEEDYENFDPMKPKKRKDCIVQ